MAIFASGSMKKCVTCQFFAGSRSTDMGKRNARYEADCEGMCRTKKAEIKAKQPACSKWEKWDELK
jgi:hypothetical protein